MMTEEEAATAIAALPTLDEVRADVEAKRAKLNALGVPTDILPELIILIDTLAEWVLRVGMEGDDDLVDLFNIDSLQRVGAVYDTILDELGA